MHDRTIDGKTEVFGNAGGLFMNAMTWWDHSTNSIWSQPWGRTIRGELKGTELFLLPSQLTTWGQWKQQHPESLAMTNGIGGFDPLFRPDFKQNFVIGLVIEGKAKAYGSPYVLQAGVINDMLDDLPVLVWAEEKNYHAYLRQVGDQVLTFRWDGENLVDQETGSVWDVARGQALSGEYEGQILHQVPSLSSYDWVWLDFYPDSTIHAPQ